MLTKETLRSKMKILGTTTILKLGLPMIVYDDYYLRKFKF